MLEYVKQLELSIQAVDKELWQRQTNLQEMKIANLDESSQLSEQTGEELNQNVQTLLETKESMCP
jgi:hypothetical protein